MLVKTKEINLKTTNQKHIKMSDIVNSGIVDTKSKDDQLKKIRDNAAEKILSILNKLL